MFKKILITGISGQLGSNLAYLMCRQCKNIPIEIIGLYNKRDTHSNFIKTMSASNFVDRSIDPDLIIHCAALTNIDVCETKPDQAFKSNVLFTKDICDLFPNSKIIYISTDNVYSGGDQIYREGDATVPKNVYGRTKLLGEKIVKSMPNDHLIFRTNIYGWDNRLESNSFLERIYRNFVRGLDNHLFHDVIYCPISINLLFEVLFECIQNDICGTYNVVGSSLSKLEFGKLICEIFGFDCRRIKPISIEEIHLEAQRPKILNLSNKKILGVYPKIGMSTFDQINDMKLIYNSGYKEKLARFINLGD